MQSTQSKLIDAGYLILRSGETNQPVIKKAVKHPPLQNVSWVVMEKFPSKAARDRRLKEFGEDPKVILDDFYRKAPYWDEERNGVVIPDLDVVLDAKNLCEGYKSWANAMDLAKVSDKRLFTRDEAYYLLWQKDTINKILLEHGGDPLDDYFWTSQEFSRQVAWFVSFSTGIVYGDVKYGTYAVRAVSAL